MAVVSISTMNAGTINNVIPQDASIGGSMRCYSKTVQDIIERRINEIAVGIGMAFGARIEVDYERSSPPVINHDRSVDYALAATRGRLHVIKTWPPAPGGEDFAFFLEAVPSAYIRIGNGDSEALHHPAFDFSDDAIATGVGLFVALVEAHGSLG
ncbi:M20/M25/M40 family metallo-hydrolase [Rhizobium leguminosarum]|uniref:M20/M25/M40 family metallo-hydrolase n=1 Tax=Rhizobium leguminosarum TaxID=384 RepID=UPI001C903B25|nr:M20/M25/M40 family metallo-hydrolase [Rhizobium leguminosarum]MBY3043761.1 amidohydrolase [Rhizobium leguminosarum]